MNDVWVCDACKSINRQRDDRCYRCNGRRDVVASAAGPDVRLVQAVAGRAVRGYVSAKPIAFVACVLILAVAVLGLLLTIAELQAVPALRQAFRDSLTTGSPLSLDAYEARQQELAMATLVRAVLLVLAVLAFGLWLRRVVLNIPALGGGIPGRGPWKALIYPMIPIVNLVKVPAMVQDALYRLEPRAGGFFMVALAWFGFVGSWLVDLVGTWVITGIATASVLTAGSIEGAVNAFGTLLDQASILALVVTLMVAVGAVLLVVIIMRIERRAAARDREIRHAVLSVSAAT